MGLGLRLTLIILIGAATVPYDMLVIATGATHSYFGHDEWAAVASGLKRIEDATRIRRSILLAFEQAELTDDTPERARLLTFVIVGAGATGVEMAGAIAEIARFTIARDFRRIDHQRPGERAAGLSLSGRACHRPRAATSGRG